MAIRVTFAAQPEMTQTHRGSPAETQHIIRRMNAAYDWTGPDDLDNPRNFPALVRILSITVISSLAFVSSFAGAIYEPAQEAVMEGFHLSPYEAVLPLSLYNLGLAFGPLVGAPFLTFACGLVVQTRFSHSTPILRQSLRLAEFSDEQRKEH
ncbi:hypothetical protein FOBRF1_012041 [Fusarium oxysporum]